MKRRIPFLALAILIAAAVAAGMLLLYFVPRSNMPDDGAVVVQQNGDGSFLLSWMELDGADGYRVEILQPMEPKEKVLFASAVEFPQCTVDQSLPEDRLLLRISPMIKYSVFGREKVRIGTKALTAEVQWDMPVVDRLQWTADPDTDTVHITLRADGAECCYVYLMSDDGACSLLETVQEERVTLQFGKNDMLPVPENGENCRIGVAAAREMPGVKLKGAVSAQMEISRQDLLGRDLEVSFSGKDNRFSLTWNETKGDSYEVQRLDSDGDWVTVKQIALNEERSFKSGMLPEFRELTYRVVATGGQTMDGSAYAAVSEPIRFDTHESPLYATVWPVKDLETYYDAKKTPASETARAGKAYCVVDEWDGMFGIRIDDQIYYIDSNYCMINLPDYVGDLCRYQITNSESSVYLVHEFEIPNVTGEVTSGYEHVAQPGGSYLVPLLYPTAKKLVSAAENAVSKGYALRIYDAFRPQKATREIYNRTASVLDSEIPEKTYTGVKVASLKLPEPDKDDRLTYQRVMTNGTYALNSFLAKGASRHNFGVALDLTLVDLETGEELRMQTSMHDLSWYSVTGHNNANARQLASIMTEAGFSPLSSEWWHFQDDESWKQLELTAVWEGISPEGWVYDDAGWRYRDQSGAFYQSCTVQIGAHFYNFDENGYLIGGDAGFG